MSCNLSISENFYQNIKNTIGYYKKNNFGNMAIIHFLDDIVNSYNRVKATDASKIYTKPDFNNQQFRYITTDKYKMKIYVKIDVEKNFVDFICLVGRNQQFTSDMFVEQFINDVLKLAGCNVNKVI